jgi:hypothetical protein
LVVEITTMDLRKGQATGTSDMCKTENENMNVVVKELR